MALIVNPNTQSLNALKKLNSTTRALGAVSERISGGLKINGAADDSTGLGASESVDRSPAGAGAQAAHADRVTLTRDAQGMSGIPSRQALSAPRDGSGTGQTEESESNEVANIIKRMRDLAAQSASETLSPDEREYVQYEFRQLSAEVERTTPTTSFNGIQPSDSADGGRAAVAVERTVESARSARQTEDPSTARALAAYARPPEPPRSTDAEPEPDRPRVDATA